MGCNLLARGALVPAPLRGGGSNVITRFMLLCGMGGRFNFTHLQPGLHHKGILRESGLPRPAKTFF